MQMDEQVETMKIIFPWDIAKGTTTRRRRQRNRAGGFGGWLLGRGETDSGPFIRPELEEKNSAWRRRGTMTANSNRG
jgi:hypothetical protein